MMTTITIASDVINARWIRHKKHLLSQIYNKFSVETEFDYDCVREHFEDYLINKQETYLTGLRFVLLSSNHFKVYTKNTQEIEISVSDASDKINEINEINDVVDTDVTNDITDDITDGIIDYIDYDYYDYDDPLSEDDVPIDNDNILIDEDEQLAISLSLSLDTTMNVTTTTDQELPQQPKQNNYVVYNQDSIATDYTLVTFEHEMYILLDIDKCDNNAIEHDEYLIVPTSDTVQTILELRDSDHKLNKVYQEFI